MTSFAHTTYANASTVAGVESASETIDLFAALFGGIAAFFRGALRGTIAVLLLAVLAVATMTVDRIDTLSHGSHLIDLAAAVAFATMAVTLLSGPARLLFGRTLR